MRSKVSLRRVGHGMSTFPVYRLPNEREHTIHPGEETAASRALMTDILPQTVVSQCPVYSRSGCSSMNVRALATASSSFQIGPTSMQRTATARSVGSSCLRRCWSWLGMCGRQEGQQVALKIYESSQARACLHAIPMVSYRILCSAFPAGAVRDEAYEQSLGAIVPKGHSTPKNQQKKCSITIKQACLENKPEPCTKGNSHDTGDKSHYRALKNTTRQGV